MNVNVIETRNFNKLARLTILLSVLVRMCDTECSTFLGHSIPFPLSIFGPIGSFMDNANE